MLPYVVVAMALIYLVLHYAGFFDRSARQGGGKGRASGSDRAEGQALTSGDEAEHRLQVFEDFLKRGGRPQDGDD